MPIDRLIATSAIVVLLAGCAAQAPETAQSSAHAGHGQSADGARPVLYDTLGTYSHKITTSSPEAQR